LRAPAGARASRCAARARCARGARPRAQPRRSQRSVAAAPSSHPLLPRAPEPPPLQALAEGGRIPAALLPILARPPPPPGSDAGGSTLSESSVARAAAAAQAAAQAALRNIPILPLISRPGQGGHGEGGANGATAVAEGSWPEYDLTPQEERLVQACQSSLNSAALALVLQSFATGLLITAALATDHVSDAITDGIQVRRAMESGRTGVMRGPQAGAASCARQPAPPTCPATHSPPLSRALNVPSSAFKHTPPHSLPIPSPTHPQRWSTRRSPQSSSLWPPPTSTARSTPRAGARAHRRRGTAVPRPCCPAPAPSSRAGLARAAPPYPCRSAPLPIPHPAHPSPPKPPSDIEHLLLGLGPKGLAKLFHQLSILAWAVVLAKLISLAAPWEESSPFFSYLNEILGHKAGGGGGGGGGFLDSF
jgi:hypothetical protein